VDHIPGNGFLPNLEYGVLGRECVGGRKYKPRQLSHTAQSFRSHYITIFGVVFIRINRPQIVIHTAYCYE
jgi:hypothetical protein